MPKSPTNGEKLRAQRQGIRLPQGVVPGLEQTKLKEDAFNQLPADLAGEVTDQVGTGVAMMGAALSQASQIVGDGAGALAVGVSGVGVIANTVALIQQYRDRGQYDKAKKAFRELAKDPHVADLVGQRETLNEMLLHQKAQLRMIERQLAILQEQRDQIIEAEGPDSPKVAIVDDAIGRVEENIGGLKDTMEQLDNRITVINRDPMMQQLRPLEAHYHLASEVLKHEGAFKLQIAEALHKGAATVVDASQGALTIASNVAGGSSLLSAAAPIAGGAAQMVTGTFQAGVSGASLAFNAWSAYKFSKKEKLAAEARQDIQDPALNAALHRMERKAHKNKIEKGVESIRDGALVVTALSSATAGAALVVSGGLALASAPGFGVGAAPGLVVTAGAGAVAVGAGVVGAGFAAGASGFKAHRHFTSSRAKKELARCEIGAKEMKRLGAMQLPCDAQGMPVKVGDPPLRKDIANAMLSLQKKAIKSGALSAEDALDPAKLEAYAALNLISRDSRRAAEVFVAKLKEECQQAINKRDGTAIVTSDLPDNTPAINAARKMGMTDEQIVQVVNAASLDITEKVAHKSIAQKMGLRGGTSADLEGVKVKPNRSNTTF